MDYIGEILKQVKEIVAEKPWVTDDDGRTSCFFCVGDHPNHYDDCPYDQIKTLLENRLETLADYVARNGRIAAGGTDGLTPAWGDLGPVVTLWRRFRDGCETREMDHEFFAKVTLAAIPEREPDVARAKIELGGAGRLPYGLDAGQLVGDYVPIEQWSVWCDDCPH